MTLKTPLAAAALSFLAAAGAQASSLYSFTGPTAVHASPDSISATFNAGAGAGLATVRINGYASLDGDNYYKDVFTLSLNGTPILSGTWDMGGGGANLTYFAPGGSTVAPHTFGFFAGGYTDISAPLSLLAGLNTLTFAYASPGGAFAGPQGTGDEGWGLQNVSVTGSAGGVPEPETWAMMLLGFSAIGATLRNRRYATAV